MAEYITIMVINNKTASQITTELEDLIASEIDPSFIAWLFEEAAKGAPGSEIAQAPPSPAQVEAPAQPGPSKEIPTFTGNDSSSRRASGAPRNGIYQQAINQALPSPSAQKRSAAARSPSPSHPNKSRRTSDLPTGPRAMQKEGPGSRSLLDRVGGRSGGHQRDEIQRRIDSVTSGVQDPNMMVPQGFPPGMHPGMDVNAMAAANMMSPMDALMMQQFALMQQMQQMAASMGMMGGQVPPGFVPNGMPGDMSMVQNNMNNFQGQPAGQGFSISVESAATVAAPSPVVATPIAATPSASSAIPDASPKSATYAVPERPQSPTLCKFGTKCTNAHCRYSHPSPVATSESGIVLSNDPCENGKDCKDKDCTKAHVSPAVLNPNADHSIPTTTAPPPRTHPTSTVPCRFGLNCTRPGCTFVHPQRNAQPCRFGAACTRATCTFQHPPGRVLPSTFHRGLSTSGDVVSVSTPATGTMGTGASHNKSMTFNKPAESTASVKEKLEKQMKELEEKKSEMEKAMKDAANKKEDAKSVAITA
ncbi:hypothetical protein NMY22_g3200 [Coprinellus aureogranulatus]|nr:hypothetical protein NMY22_g3200 [Coprinellus aureogranulatus]